MESDLLKSLYVGDTVHRALIDSMHDDNSLSREHGLFNIIWRGLSQNLQASLIVFESTLRDEMYDVLRTEEQKKPLG